jgi:hypothetical protein
MKRLLIFGGLIAVVIIAVLWVVNRPFMAASFCPRCVGFREIDKNIFVERRSNLPSDKVIVSNIQTARRNVALFFGELRADPTLLICGSEPFYRKLDGRQGAAKAISWVDRTTLVSPRGDNVVIITHELAHAELHHRLGLVALSKVPPWFDEGLAAYVSDDPRYLSPIEEENRCITSRAPNDWIGGDFYRKSACRVSEWLSSRGGPRAVRKLIDDLNRGMSFQQAYGS